MRILGIDPGLNITGYGCVDTDPGSMGTTPALVEAGCIRLARSEPMARRLVTLHDELTALAAELKPDCMVVEQLFSHYRHARTSILMGHARGVVLLVAAQHQVELDELMPTEVKKAVTGNGHATKMQVQRAVQSQCQLAELPTPNDVADAIAIALCAARRLDTVRV